MKTKHTVPVESANTYRYERKFLVEGIDPQHVLMLIRLHPALFLEPFPPRYVNNIYLDTPGMDYYHENIAGVQDRRKVRIRWYGDLFGRVSKPVLEFKIKDGLIGRKESFSFPAFDLDERFERRYFRRVLAESELPHEVGYYMRDLDPVLVNRYYRRYYATADSCFRITVDTGMCFYHVDGAANSFCYRQFNYLHTVIELKYDTQYDRSANQVAQYFPFPVVKNSKYVEGIERVYL